MQSLHRMYHVALLASVALQGIVVVVTFRIQQLFWSSVQTVVLGEIKGATSIYNNFIDKDH